MALTNKCFMSYVAFLGQLIHSVEPKGSLCCIAALVIVIFVVAVVC